MTDTQIEPVEEPTLDAYIHLPGKTAYIAVRAIFHEIPDLTEEEAQTWLPKAIEWFGSQVEGARNAG